MPRFFLKGESYTKKTKIDGKVAIVTGANSGMGKETAIDLARRGGKVYLACRDTKKGEDALKEVKEKSKSSNVHFLQLDLASLDSIREFSAKFHTMENCLHILVNNAGVMACAKSLTTDGFEMHLGTNHLGHFLLTNLLLDLLKQTTPSRIVVVSALAHKFGTINKEDLMSENSYSRFKAFCQSKLANNLFVKELSKKLEGSGVTVNAANPGIVISGFLSRLPEMIKTVVEPVLRQFLQTPKEGAQTSIFLSVDPEVEKISGKYFGNLKENDPSDDSKNDELSCWLWQKSEELLKLNYV